MGEYFITVGQVIDAIEKNGLEKFKGEYFQVVDHNIIGGCAFGQATLNIYKDLADKHGLYMPDDLWDRADALAVSFDVAIGPNPTFNIIDANDATDLTLPEIAQKARERLKNSLDKSIRIVIPEEQPGEY